MPDVKVIIEGDVTIISAGEDSELAEYIAQIIQDGPFGDKAEIEIME